MKVNCVLFVSCIAQPLTLPAKLNIVVIFFLTENKTGQRPNVDNKIERNRVSNFTENRDRDREERNNRRNKEEKTFNGQADPGVNRCVISAIYIEKY